MWLAIGLLQPLCTVTQSVVDQLVRQPHGNAQCTGYLLQGLAAQAMHFERHAGAFRQFAKGLADHPQFIPAGGFAFR